VSFVLAVQVAKELSSSPAPLTARAQRPHCISEPVRPGRAADRTRRPLHRRAARQSAAKRGRQRRFAPGRATTRCACPRALLHDDRVAPPQARRGAARKDSRGLDQQRHRSRWARQPQRAERRLVLGGTPAYLARIRLGQWPKIVRRVALYARRARRLRTARRPQATPVAPMRTRRGRSAGLRASSRGWRPGRPCPSAAVR
jgi:hypothetical protein